MKQPSPVHFLNFCRKHEITVPAEKTLPCSPAGHSGLAGLGGRPGLGCPAGLGGPAGLAGPASLGGLACFGGPTCLGGGASAAGLGGPTAGPSRASGWRLLEGPWPARPWLPLAFGVWQLSLAE